MMKYGDKINHYEGVIVEVHDGGIALDIKGRLGYMKIPMRMLISDYPLKVGQTVAFNMSFIEQISDEVDEKYVLNVERAKQRRNEWLESQKTKEEE